MGQRYHAGTGTGSRVVGRRGRPLVHHPRQPSAPIQCRSPGPRGRRGLTVPWILPGTLGAAAQLGGASHATCARTISDSGGGERRDQRPHSSRVRGVDSLATLDRRRQTRFERRGAMDGDAGSQCSMAPRLHQLPTRCLSALGHARRLVARTRRAWLRTNYVAGGITRPGLPCPSGQSGADCFRPRGLGRDQPMPRTRWISPVRPPRLDRTAGAALAWHSYRYCLWGSCISASAGVEDHCGQSGITW